jgi:hypothetical protein
MTSVPFMRP